MELKDVVVKSKEFAYDEINKNGSPKLELLDISVEKGIELADKLGEDKEVVAIGCYLMDIALGDALKEGRAKDHVIMSVEKSRKFLVQFNLSEDIINRILLCVSSHHNKNGFDSKESEICANGDCYRFLHPFGIFRFLISHGERNLSYEEGLNFSLKKLEEKWSILSLDVCKQELEPYYNYFKKELSNAKKRL